jgi:uncharacterized protein YuzE
MNLRVTFDPLADAAYIYLRDPEPGFIHHTIIVDEVPINLDLDRQGRLVGIEILSARATLRPEFIDAAERL